MEKLYIKFIEWDLKSLYEACKIAEKIGYKKLYVKTALTFEGKWLLKLEDDWEYFTTISTEEELIQDWYKEYKELFENEVYVSDISIENALDSKNKRIYLTTIWQTHICVTETYESNYRKWEFFSVSGWKYIVKIPKEEEKKKVTLELTEKQLEQIKDILF